MPPPKNNKTTGGTIQERMSEILSHSENRVCIDCGDRTEANKDPEYATLLAPKSTDPWPLLAAFCCYQCCMLHFRLGDEICSVKHLDTLDDLQTEDVVAFESGGNKKVNQLFEATLKGRPNVALLKPHPQSEEDMKFIFIRDKYEHRRYYSDNIFHSTTQYTPTANLLEQLVREDLPYRSLNGTTRRERTNRSEMAQKYRDHKSLPGPQVKKEALVTTREIPIVQDQEMEKAPKGRRQHTLFKKPPPSNSDKSEATATTAATDSSSSTRSRTELLQQSRGQRSCNAVALREQIRAPAVPTQQQPASDNNNDNNKNVPFKSWGNSSADEVVCKGWNNDQSTTGRPDKRSQMMQHFRASQHSMNAADLKKRIMGADEETSADNNNKDDKEVQRNNSSSSGIMSLFARQASLSKLGKVLNKTASSSKMDAGEASNNNQEQEKAKESASSSSSSGGMFARLTRQASSSKVQQGTTGSSAAAGNAGNGYISLEPGSSEMSMGSVPDNNNAAPISTTDMLNMRRPADASMSTQDKLNMRRPIDASMSTEDKLNMRRPIDASMSTQEKLNMRRPAGGSMSTQDRLNMRKPLPSRAASDFQQREPSEVDSRESHLLRKDESEGKRPSQTEQLAMSCGNLGLSFNYNLDSHDDDGDKKGEDSKKSEDTDKDNSEKGGEDDTDELLNVFKSNVSAERRQNLLIDQVALMSSMKKLRGLGDDKDRRQRLLSAHQNKRRDMRKTKSARDVFGRAGFRSRRRRSHGDDDDEDDDDDDDEEGDKKNDTEDAALPCRNANRRATSPVPSSRNDGNRRSTSPTRNPNRRGTSPMPGIRSSSSRNLLDEGTSLVDDSKDEDYCPAGVFPDRRSRSSRTAQAETKPDRRSQSSKNVLGENPRGGQPGRSTRNLLGGDDSTAAPSRRSRSSRNLMANDEPEKTVDSRNPITPRASRPTLGDVGVKSTTTPRRQRSSRNLMSENEEKNVTRTPGRRIPSSLSAKDLFSDDDRRVDILGTPKRSRPSLGRTGDDGASTGPARRSALSKNGSWQNLANSFADDFRSKSKGAPRKSGSSRNLMAKVDKSPRRSGSSRNLMAGIDRSPVTPRRSLSAESDDAVSPSRDGRPSLRNGRPSLRNILDEDDKAPVSPPRRVPPRRTFSGEHMMAKSNDSPPTPRRTPRSTPSGENAKRSLSSRNLLGGEDSKSNDTSKRTPRRTPSGEFSKSSRRERSSRNLLGEEANRKSRSSRNLIG